MEPMIPEKEKRYFVKILFSPSGSRALAETAYFRKDMHLVFLNRWQWYFDYRMSLLKVQNPRAFVFLEQGCYDYVLPRDQYLAKVKNTYIGHKRMLSIFNNKLAELRHNWNELFPLEDHPDWKKICEKKERYQNLYEESKKIFLSENVKSRCKVNENSRY